MKATTEMAKEVLREKIARLMCERDGWDWDGIPEKITHLFGYSKSKSYYYGSADEILALLEEIGY